MTPIRAHHTPRHTAIKLYNFQAMSRTVFHHYSEEFDDNLGAGSDKYLSLAPLFGVTYRHKGVVQYAHTHHGCKRTISMNTKSRNQTLGHASVDGISLDTSLGFNFTLSLRHAYLVALVDPRWKKEDSLRMRHL